jgi:hypothetical protein
MFVLSCPVPGMVMAVHNTPPRSRGRIGPWFEIDFLSGSNLALRPHSTPFDLNVRFERTAGLPGSVSVIVYVTSPGSPARRSGAPSIFRPCRLSRIRAVQVECLLISPIQALSGAGPRSAPLRSPFLPRGSGGPPSSARGSGGARIGECGQAGIGFFRRRGFRWVWRSGCPRSDGPLGMTTRGWAAETNN